LTLPYSLLLSVWVDPSSDHKPPTVSVWLGPGGTSTSRASSSKGLFLSVFNRSTHLKNHRDKDILLIALCFYVARSGRHVNISIASSTRGGQGGASVLLNHITTPNVLIYSAVAASCALPGILSIYIYVYIYLYIYNVGHVSPLRVNPRAPPPCGCNPQSPRLPRCAAVSLCGDCCHVYSSMEEATSLMVSYPLQ